MGRDWRRAASARAGRQAWAEGLGYAVRFLGGVPDGQRDDVAAACRACSRCRAACRLGGRRARASGSPTWRPARMASRRGGQRSRRSRRGPVNGETGLLDAHSIPAPSPPRSPGCCSTQMPRPTIGRGGTRSGLRGFAWPAIAERVEAALLAIPSSSSVNVLYVNHTGCGQRLASVRCSVLLAALPPRAQRTCRDARPAHRHQRRERLGSRSRRSGDCGSLQPAPDSHSAWRSRR